MVTYQNPVVCLPHILRPAHRFMPQIHPQFFRHLDVILVPAGQPGQAFFWVPLFLFFKIIQEFFERHFFQHRNRVKIRILCLQGPVSLEVLRADPFLCRLNHPVLTQAHIKPLIERQILFADLHKLSKSSAIPKVQTGHTFCQLKQPQLHQVFGLREVFQVV